MIISKQERYTFVFLIPDDVDYLSSSYQFIHKCQFHYFRGEIHHVF